MSDFFDDSHVTDVGLQGSAGPAVGWWDMVTQSTRQQYRVGSALALDEELRTRWMESLSALRTAGQNFNGPVDPMMYRGYARFVREGTPVTTATIEGGEQFREQARRASRGGPVYMGGQNLRVNEDVRQPHPEFEEMRRANEAIRQLNNPEIRTFEQILEEVGQMQRGIEEETASMRERAPTGSFFAELLGGAAGSFTLRDPLNVVTAPIGAGRTIAMRIATDVAVAAGVTAATEYGDIMPNRALAGLPEHNPLVDIGLAAFGAGIIRGGIIEPAAFGLRTLRARGEAARLQENIDFNLRDSQLQQMFGAIDTPTARAGASILDDTIFFERTNPYGEGQVAGYRWQAELESTARALNGEEEPSAPLPPMPSEYVDRALSFQTVRETAPELWNRLETSQQRINELSTQIEQRTELRPEVTTLRMSLSPSRELDPVLFSHLWESERRSYTRGIESAREAIGIDPTFWSERIVPAIERQEITDAATLRSFVSSAGEDAWALDRAEHISGADPSRIQKTSPPDVSLIGQLRAANKEYKAAYRAVEAEAERLEMAEAAKRSEAQAQSIDVLGPNIVSEPMTGPLTRKDFVEAHVARTEEADAATPAAADAVNELKLDLETNTVDIGTKTPVSADFKVPFDDGELSVREILDDLAEDKRLEEAVKGCAI